MTPAQDARLEATLAYVRSGEPDLTNRQMAMLMLVTWTPGPHTVRSLAQELLVAKPVITRATDRLVQLGFVKRRRDPEDKRVVLITGTGEGLVFLARLEAFDMREAAE